MVFSNDENDYMIKAMQAREAKKIKDKANMKEREAEEIEKSARNLSNPFNMRPARTLSQATGVRAIMTGASIHHQHKWKRMDPSQRIAKRMIYPDTDGDGVPDKYDCQPKNRYRQDTGVNADTTGQEPVPTEQYDQPIGPERQPTKTEKFVEGAKSLGRKASTVLFEEPTKTKYTYLEEKGIQINPKTGKPQKVVRYVPYIEEQGRPGGIIPQVTQSFRAPRDVMGFGQSYQADTQKIQTLLGHQQYHQQGGFFGQPTIDQYGRRTRSNPSDKINALTGIGSQGGIYQVLGMKNPNTSTYRGRDPEHRREYMKNYMRQRRAKGGQQNA